VSTSFFNFASCALCSAASELSPSAHKSRYSVFNSLGFMILCFLAGGGPSREGESARARRSCVDRPASEALLEGGDRYSGGGLGELEARLDSGDEGGDGAPTEAMVSDGGRENREDGSETIKGGMRPSWTGSDHGGRVCRGVVIESSRSSLVEVVVVKWRKEEVGLVDI
jgi:hypothetical protein